MTPWLLAAIIIVPMSLLPCSSSVCAPRHSRACPSVASHILEWSPASLPSQPCSATWLDVPFPHSWLPPSSHQPQTRCFPAFPEHLIPCWMGYFLMFWLLNSVLQLPVSKPQTCWTRRMAPAWEGRQWGFCSVETKPLQCLAQKDVWRHYSFMTVFNVQTNREDRTESSHIPHPQVALLLASYMLMCF